MPVIHRYTDQNGFYILAVPYSLDTPVTYQVRDGLADMFTRMELTDGDRVSWSLLRPFIAINQLYTQQSGVTDSAEVMNNLSDLDSEEQAIAIDYFEQYFDLSGSQLTQLREFVKGETDTMPSDLTTELNSQLTTEGSEQSTTGANFDDQLLNNPIGNEAEFKKYLSALFDLSEQQLETLEHLLNGDLVQITPGLGSEFQERFTQETELSEAEFRKERLIKLVESSLREEFDDPAWVALSLRGVPGGFGNMEDKNYNYQDGVHTLLGLSDEQVQASKELFKQLDADLHDKTDGLDGVMISFKTLSRPNHHNAESEVDRMLRAIEYVYNSDITDIHRAHAVNYEYTMRTDDSDGIMKPGWDDRNIDV